MNIGQSMSETAQELVDPGNGILAAGESTPTMKKRLAAIGVESTESVRRAYHEILFSPDAGAIDANPTRAAINAVRGRIVAQPGG